MQMNYAYFNVSFNITEKHVFYLPEIEQGVRVRTILNL